jgi:hypothetical protein
VSFRNLCAFLAQMIPYQDSDLEQFYTYTRFLLSKLPRRPAVPATSSKMKLLSVTIVSNRSAPGASIWRKTKPSP